MKSWVHLGDAALVDRLIRVAAEWSTSTNKKDAQAVVDLRQEILGRLERYRRIRDLHSVAKARGPKTHMRPPDDEWNDGWDAMCRAALTYAPVTTDASQVTCINCLRALEEDNDG